jgi:putative glycosyltransferase (TIGR04372 family)
MRSRDLYLPRWLKNIQTDELVSFEHYMLPPISNFWSMQHFLDAGLHWIENTPDELEDVTKEMLERIEDDLPSTIDDDDLQRRFKAMAETCGLKYGGRPVKAFAPISRDFLERHAYLLKD